MRLQKEQLQQWALILLLGSIGAAGGTFASQAAAPLLNLFLPAVPPETILWLALTSILLNILLLWWIASNQFHLWKRHYVENLEFGYYEHRKTNRKICASCFTEGIESPLFGVYQNLICYRPTCKAKAINPTPKEEKK